METLSRADRLWLSSMRLCRKYCGCHQMEARSFTVRGYQFPLCARCTGIAIGHIIGLILGCAADVSLWIALLMLPLALDGGIQYLTAYESNNRRRLVTGILYGAAFMSLCVRLLQWIITYLMGN